MQDKARRKSGVGACQGNGNDPRKDPGGYLEGCFLECEEGKRADDQKCDLLRELGQFIFVIPVEDHLHDVGLVFHAVHMLAVIDGREIFILQSDRVRADQHDLVLPGIACDLAFDQICQGIPV